MLEQGQHVHHALRERKKRKSKVLDQDKVLELQPCGSARVDGGCDRKGRQAQPDYASFDITQADWFGFRLPVS